MLLLNTASTDSTISARGKMDSRRSCCGLYSTSASGSANGCEPSGRRNGLTIRGRSGLCGTIRLEVIVKRFFVPRYIIAYLTPFGFAACKRGRPRLPNATLCWLLIVPPSEPLWLMIRCVLLNLSRIPQLSREPPSRWSCCCSWQDRRDREIVFPVIACTKGIALQLCRILLGQSLRNTLFALDDGRSAHLPFFLALWCLFIREYCSMSHRDSCRASESRFAAALACIRVY